MSAIRTFHASPLSRSGRRRTLSIVVLGLAVMAFSGSSASAETLFPWFHLTSVSRPGHLTGRSGEIAVTAVNVGDASVNAGAVPVVLSDVLPEHLRVRSIEEGTKNSGNTQLAAPKCEVSQARKVVCTFSGGTLPPFHQIEMLIGVSVEAGASTGESNEASISGGGAPSAEIKHPITVSNAPTPFGVEDYEPDFEEVGGAPDTQAGSHPFQYTTTLDLSAGLAFDPEAGREVGVPAALVKDLVFKLPPGFVGDPTAYPRCSLGRFLDFPHGGANLCPADTIIGASAVTYSEDSLGGKLGLQTRAQPIFNLEPGPGEPAKFGFAPASIPIYLDTSVRTGEDYGVTVHVDNIPQIVGFLSNTVTFWGVPGDARHNDARGLGCFDESVASENPCQPDAPAESNPPAFLTMPTSCSGVPLEGGVEADAGLRPGVMVAPNPNPSEPMPTMDGCDLLPFYSEIKVTPDVQEASKPSGLTADVHVPQEEALSAEGLAPPQLQNITVTLPEGVDLNPSAADGLAACPLLSGREPEKEARESKGELAGINLETPEPANCPNASKIANVEINTPLLPNPLKGFVYLASPQNFRSAPPENPFEALVAQYLVAEDPISGTLIKLPGKISLSATGQITATFMNNPQLPFEDAKLKFFGGERAPLATPSLCGSYTTNAIFEPWTNTATDHEALHATSVFDIIAGPNGGPCPGATLPFDPSLSSETTNINAGSFTPLSTTLSREDGQQSIQSVTLHYPPGISGLLSGVKLCGEAEANAGTCGPESEIGETIVSVGLGGDPFTVTGGKVYITGPYQGAPFGLSIVNPAKAGPFDLQEGRPVVVRAKLEVDPTTAALTITTDPPGSPHAIPTIIEGFPLQIKHVNVTITRKDFTFNPTNCDPMKITGAIDSAEGASSPVEVPFQVTNCAVLKFTPKFSVSTSGKTSKADGASLTATVIEPSEPHGSQANIAKVKVELPKQLPSRLTTLQKACTAAQFEANPSGCPGQSVIGHARVITPLVPVPLEGPVYFVSHGGEAFPSLEIVLQGYGVRIDLVGTTFISKAGITSTTFKTVPDQPFNSFEITLPEGPYSALAANGDLCTQKLVMPTEFIGQNGAAVDQRTPIGVTGCAKTKALTRAQKLAKALRACRKDKRHGTRASCERQARRTYGAKRRGKKQ